MRERVRWLIRGKEMIKGQIITCPYCGTKFPHSGLPELQECPKCHAKLLTSNPGSPMITDVDTCLKEIADWYVEKRRKITVPELEAILLRHCEDEAEVQKFLKFLETEPGEMRFRTLLEKMAGGESQKENPVSNTYTSLQLFDPSMKEKIITAWQKNRVVFWKYGTIRPHFNDVAVCLKERKIRNLISGEEIAEYLAKRKSGSPEEEDTIFFNVPEAREQLIREGYVYTLRPRMRKTGRDVAYYGSYYKKERIGDVWVAFVKEIEDMEELKPYFYASGFKKLTDWREAAKGSRFLFRVSLER